MKIMFLSYSPRGKSRGHYDNETQRQLETYASPGTEIVLAKPEDLGGGVIDKKLSEEVAINGLHHQLRVPALIEKVIEAERTGFDAVIQSNTYDPGVEQARLAVRIPVVGILRATCHVAACLAHRVGVTILVDSMIPYTRCILRDYGLTSLVTSIKAVGMYETGDLAKVREPIKKKVIELAKELKAEGAELVIPLGGRLSRRDKLRGNRVRGRYPHSQHQSHRHPVHRDARPLPHEPQPDRLPVPHPVFRGGSHEKNIWLGDQAYSLFAKREARTTWSFR